MSEEYVNFLVNVINYDILDNYKVFKIFDFFNRIIVELQHVL